MDYGSLAFWSGIFCIPLAGLVNLVYGLIRNTILKILGHDVDFFSSEMTADNWIVFILALIIFLGFSINYYF